MSKRPNIESIKKALAEKQRARLQAEEEAKSLSDKLNKQAEANRVSEVIHEQIVVPTATKKVPRFAFMRKDISTVETKKEVAEVETKCIESVFKSPIACILGHVDTGKTKLLDKLRRTSVQLGEAGGITQQIGATYFPSSYLKETCAIETKFPGLLMIDTPGHESFTNLRSRGSSMCNIAILVVDIMHSLEPQTIESIGLLKMRKTPFIVALNKIDRIYGWESEDNSSRFNIEKQSPEAKRLFTQRLDNIVVALSEQGLNTALFNKNSNPKRVISIVPTSAISGEGIPNLFETLIDLCEKFMETKLTFRNDIFEGSVLEVKTEEGHGLTIDVIISNGTLSEGDKICVCTFDGPKVVVIKTLLIPEACRETRARPGFKSVKYIKGSRGIKIVAIGLENVVPGTSIVKILKSKGKKENEENHEISTGILSEEEAKKYLSDELDSIIKSVNIEEVGVHVQASTLGSLEALLSFLKDKIPVSSIALGPIRKKDIAKTAIMHESKPEYAVMLCFDVKIDKEMSEVAKEYNVKMISADIIYHLLDSFHMYLENYYKKVKEENKPVHACKLLILPNCVWNKRSPIVMGVEITGKLSLGATLITAEGMRLGKVTSIENNKKSVEIAHNGEKVSIKVETNETPRMLGRHFTETDIFYSFLCRKDIQTLRKYYENEVDWDLVKEIENIFEIY